MRRGFRSGLTALFLAVAGGAHAERILLVPLDSRPAAGQFAQMIGRMTGVRVETPPVEFLGHFTQPGSPEKILAWLEAQDYADVLSVVASTDMIAYGGLIASRLENVSSERALARLKRLTELRARNPEMSFYAFSSLMRLAPTGTQESQSWALKLSEYVALRERVQRTGEASLRPKLQRLKAAVPAAELKRYEAARARSHDVQRMLVKYTQWGLFDYLVVGQDDAQPYGPHVAERGALETLAAKVGITGRVYFCEGIDQHSNVLVSRALLRRAGWIPKVKVVYAEDAGRRRHANYESRTVEESLRDQLFASGARLAALNEPIDYTLYVNTPHRRPEAFGTFAAALRHEVDAGGDVCVADINLGVRGSPDPALYSALRSERRMMRLLAYAGWNTAGNTLGTAIPAANMTLLARRFHGDSLQAELARREFLLHRLANDYYYHQVMRPRAYELIDLFEPGGREEVSRATYEKVDAYVRREMTRKLNQLFEEQVQGARIEAEGRTYQLSGVENVRVFLPWPRAYEVALEFQLVATPVEEPLVKRVDIR